MFGLRVGWLRRRSKGAHLYASGPLSTRPGGRFGPPGLLSRLTMSEGRDAYDRPFGVLHHPGRNTYTIVLSCEPDGGSLVDPDQTDVWVAAWGQWLARLSQEPQLRGACVVVETAPDSGTRLANEVLPRITADAPAAAQAVMREVVERYPSASSEMYTYIALTYGVLPGQKRQQSEIVTELAMRIPGLLSGLVGAGGGSAAPLSAERICEVVRVAYDPDIAGDVLDARARHGTTGLVWEDSKPRGRRGDGQLLPARLRHLPHLAADPGAARHRALQRAARPPGSRPEHPAQAGRPALPAHRPGDLGQDRRGRPTRRPVHGHLGQGHGPGPCRLRDACRRADRRRGGRRLPGSWSSPSWSP